MGRVGLILGAVALSLVAAGAFFWKDIQRLTGRVSEEQLVTDLKTAAAGGGYAVTFAQADSSKWHVGDGHRLEKFSLDNGATAFARLTSTVALNPDTVDWPTQGLSTLFPMAFNNKTNAGKLEIGVIARQPATNGSKAISVVYATNQAGNSGWHDIAIGPDFRLTSFTYDVPKVAPGGYIVPPILVINADRSGKGGAAEILGIYVKQIQ